MATRGPRAILIHPSDTVATALEPLAAGCRVRLATAGRTIRVEVAEDIPVGHKFSVFAVVCGDPVVKYGECIGRATADIPVGRHVHVQNLSSDRGRGDRPAAPADPMGREGGA